MSRTTAIVQARMGSTRLPGKVLMHMAGKPMMGRLLQRLSGSTRLERIVVATSTSAQDDAVADYAASLGVPVFRGSEADVLDRYYHAAKTHEADPVVRITADCPLIDPEVVDVVIGAFFDHDVDMALNSFRETYPDGLDTDVFSFMALERCWKEAPEGPFREHVHSYVLKHPELFTIHHVINDEDLRKHSWSVDSPADFAYAEAIFEMMGGDGVFHMAQILDCIARHPEMFPVDETRSRNEWKKLVGL